MATRVVSQEERRTERVALLEIMQAQREVVTTMFRGTQLVFGSKAKATWSIGSGAVFSVLGVKGVVGAASSTFQAASLTASKTAVENFIATCAQVDNVQEVAQAIGSDAMTELTKQIMPYVGVALGAKDMVAAGYVVVKDGRNLYKSYDQITGFRHGDPVAAAEAVQVLIKRDLTRGAIDLSRHTAATGVKIAGLFADMGTATTALAGLANTLAGLGLEIFAIGRDIKEMKAGNKRLVKPETLDVTIFEECPVLGCYLLTCADTSLVANFFVFDIGKPGWMDRVEALKKGKMDPLLKVAAQKIQKSRLQLEGLAADKGTHMEKGFFAKKKSKFTAWRTNRKTGVTKILEDRIEGRGATA